MIILQCSVIDFPRFCYWQLMKRGPRFKPLLVPPLNVWILPNFCSGWIICCILMEDQPPASSLELLHNPQDCSSFISTNLLNFLDTFIFLDLSFRQKQNSAQYIFSLCTYKLKFNIDMLILLNVITDCRMFSWLLTSWQAQHYWHQGVCWFILLYYTISASL